MKTFLQSRSGVVGSATAIIALVAACVVVISGHLNQIPGTVVRHAVAFTMLEAVAMVLMVFGLLVKGSGPPPFLRAHPATGCSPTWPASNWPRPIPI